MKQMNLYPKILPNLDALKNKTQTRIAFLSPLLLANRCYSNQWLQILSSFSFLQLTSQYPHACHALDNYVDGSGALVAISSTPS